MRVNDVFPPTCAQEFIVLTGSAEYEAYRRACVAVLLGHDVDVPCTWDAANAKRLHEFSTRTALERSVGVDAVRRSFRSDRPERLDTERAKFGTAIDALPALPLADVIRRREGAAKRARSASGRGAGDGATARTPDTEEEHDDVTFDASLGLGPHLQPIADKDWARFGPIVAAWGEASGEPKPLCPIVNHDRAVMVAPSGFRLLNDALYAKLQQERPRLSGPKRAALNGTKSACAMGLVPETLHPPHPPPCVLLRRDGDVVRGRQDRVALRHHAAGEATRLGDGRRQLEAGATRVLPPRGVPQPRDAAQGRHVVDNGLQRKARTSRLRVSHRPRTRVAPLLPRPLTHIATRPSLPPPFCPSRLIPHHSLTSVPLPPTHPHTHTQRDRRLRVLERRHRRHGTL